MGVRDEVALLVGRDVSADAQREALDRVPFVQGSLHAWVVGVMNDERGRLVANALAIASERRRYICTNPELLEVAGINVAHPVLHVALAFEGGCVSPRQEFVGGDGRPSSRVRPNGVAVCSLDLGPSESDECFTLLLGSSTS